MTKRLLSYDDGISTFHELKDGKTIITTSQNVEPILSVNKEALANSRTDWKGDWHHVAAIPKEVYHAWWKEFGGDPLSPEHKVKTIARLNSSDWAKLRTKEGNI
jgi:hypothetical protein